VWRAVEPVNQKPETSGQWSVVSGQWSDTRCQRPATSIAILGVGSLIAYLIWPATHYRGSALAFVSYYAIQLALYGLACWVVWRSESPGKHTLQIILLFAVVFRVALLPTTPNLSNDIYRYIWDGKVQATGTNPYRYAPEAEALTHLRDERIFPHINRRDYARTIYPPGAQMIFLGAYSLFGESVLGMKFAMVAFDLLMIAVLLSILKRLKIDLSHIIIYAWHPLATWEVAHSGHIDVAAVTLLIAALLFRMRERMLLSGCFLGLATLVKFYPALLLPAFYKKWDWKLPVGLAATVVLGYLPYLSVGAGVLGFLPGYLQEEDFRSGKRFFPLEVIRLLMPFPTRLYLLLVALIVGLLALRLIYKKLTEEEQVLGSQWLIGAILLLMTPHYPWYSLWLIPFLCFRPAAAWLYLVSASPLLYFTWYRGVSELALGCFQYLPVYGLLIRRVILRHHHWRLD
jgi:hypothetical protein